MSNARNLANLLTGGDTTIATGDVANDAVTVSAKIDDDGTGFQMGDLTLGTTLTVGKKKCYLTHLVVQTYFNKCRVWRCIYRRR